MKRFAIISATTLLCVLCFARLAPAQNIVSYQLQVYQPGVDPVAGAPFQTSTIPVANVTCNQAPLTPPTTPVPNPTRVGWDDPANIGKECIVDQTTFLLALPNLPASCSTPATCYQATVTVTDDLSQTSARSVASNPFTRVPPPPVRTGLRVSR